MRKVIQVVIATQAPELEEFGSRDKTQEVVVVALCDDGSSWLIRPDEHDALWKRLPDIPQQCDVIEN